MKRQPSRFDISVTDYVKFKSLKTQQVENSDFITSRFLQKNKDYSQDQYKKKEFNIFYGQVMEICSRTGNIGVKIFKEENVREQNFQKYKIPGYVMEKSPLEYTDQNCQRQISDTMIFIEKKQILQVYNYKLIDILTPRLALKHIWSDFIFREVKTSKATNLLYAEYRYIGGNGFEKIKRFKTMEEAEEKVPPEFHKNIITCHEEFFGFTTDRAIRNNDIYHDKEIFFSKKCYTELDWSEKTPTGDFLINERGYNHEAPKPDSLICGIVENGEKGLFYRKWFLCSPEFLTLWTMVCDPGNDSLYELDTKHLNWNEIRKNHIEKKKKIKDFDHLLKQLQTCSYHINMKLEVNERKIKYTCFNLERAALYYQNRYKQVAEVLFSKGYIGKDNSSYSEDILLKHSSFQKRLIRNLLWCKYKVS